MSPTETKIHSKEDEKTCTVTNTLGEDLLIYKEGESDSIPLLEQLRLYREYPKHRKEKIKPTDNPYYSDTIQKLIDYRTTCKKIVKRNKELVSLRCAFQIKLDIAKEFKD